MIDKLKALITVIALAPHAAFAQKVSEGKVKMGHDHKDGFVARSEYGKTEMLETIDGKLKDAGIGKRKMNKGFRAYKGVTWTAVSGTKMDVCYKVKGNKRKSTVYMVASKGYDNYITSSTDAVTAANLTAFLQSLDHQAELNEQIKAKQNDLKDLDHQAKKTEEEKKKTQKDLQQLQAK